MVTRSRVVTCRPASTALILVVFLGGMLLVGARFNAQRMALEGATVSTLSLSPITEYQIPPVGALLKNAGPLSIAPGQAGSFWVAEFSAGAIAQFFPSNASFHQFPVPGSFHLPTYIAVDTNGRVWFSDQAGSGSIWMFDPATRNFTEHLIPTSFAYPVGVAFDQQHDVWFTEDSGNKLGELVYPKYSVVEYSLPRASSGPAELAVGPGAIWVTESLGLRVAMFNMTTHMFKEFTPTVPLGSPVGIVLDVKGDVWFADHGGNSIVELNPGTGAFTYFPTSSPQASSGFSNSAPATLVIDGQGRLWFVEHFSNKIGRLDPASGKVDEFKIPSTGVYSVESALDSAGNFWFTEFTSNKIGTTPGNASIPQQVSASAPVSAPPSVTSGSTITSRFTISNDGVSTAYVRLNATSTFRVDGYTTSSEVSLNVSSVSLAPGESKVVVATITPDAALTPGVYAIGVVADLGNSSTLGVLELQVTLNPLYTLQQNVPDLLFLAIVILVVANFVLYGKIDEVRTKLTGLASISVPLFLSIALALLVLQVSVPVAMAKCPGLPGLGSTSNGPDYVGIIITAIETPITIVLAYFLVKGYLTLRRIKVRSKSQSETP